MMAHLYGFDWGAYTGLLMPAFARWLLRNDYSAVSPLFAQTRCAREEQEMPPVLQPSCTWPRAQLFVRQLLRRTHTRREYELLCSPEQFTAVSDTYVYRHPPRLYPLSDELRRVWGSTLEIYCLSSFTLPSSVFESTQEGRERDSTGIASLLHRAGLDELALQVREQALDVASSVQLSGLVDELESTMPAQPRGVTLGAHPAALLLRGWLARRSVRAMALFELLACGRRCLPFGSRPGERYESYIGYLTPEETYQFAMALQHEQIPDPPEQIERESAHYAMATSSDTKHTVQHHRHSSHFQMIDELPPLYASSLLQVVRMAAQYRLGLVCSLG